MNLDFIAQKLQEIGFDIQPQEIKASNKWENAKLFDNSKGKKSGRYIVNNNLCSFVNNKTLEKGCFVLDRAQVISKFELEKTRKQFEKSQKDKYFNHSRLANEKFRKINTKHTTTAYLIKKQIPAASEIKIDEHANLVIPLKSLYLNSQGEVRSYIRTLQTITPEGMKILEKDCEKTGNMHFIGLNPVTKDPKTFKGIILVAEGYATAASLHLATQLPVVMAIDAGNIDPVMERLTKVYSSAQFLICADNDYKTEASPINRNIGVEAAKAAACKYNCDFTYPDFGVDKLKYSDFNDLAVTKGNMEVKKVIQQAIEKINFNSLLPFKIDFSSNQTVLDSFKAHYPKQINEIEAKKSIHVNQPGGGALSLNTENPMLLAKLLTKACAIEVHITNKNNLSNNTQELKNA